MSFHAATCTFSTEDTLPDHAGYQSMSFMQQRGVSALRNAHVSSLDTNELYSDMYVQD
jgi:hypothetical protein